MVRRALHVAEKPSVAKALAEIMANGNARARQGVAQYNRVSRYRVYEFSQLLWTLTVCSYRTAVPARSAPSQSAP